MLSRQIAQKLRGYETPFYLYDTALLRQTLESVVYESKKYGYKVHYAIKANYDDHLLAIIREYGLGIDCASGNELRKAIEAGFDPKGIVYAGVGKRDKELRYAIEQDILAINCESIEELELVDALAGEAGRVADVALRINPDIDPKTNHCIDTGQADSKFGISYEEVLEHAKEIRALKYINIIGLHLHIGSQIRELHVFENMCNKVNVIVENLEKLGCSFRFVDVGGGLGVNYDVKKLPVGVSKPSVSMKSWKTSKPISVSCINVSATVICMLRPKRFATPFWVWAMTAVFCCKPSTNTLQASSNVWAKTAPIPPMRITACGAGVLQLCTNTNTMSRTFRSKS